MTRFSRTRIIAAAGLAEHIPAEQSGKFENIEVEPGVVTTLVLKPGAKMDQAIGGWKPRRMFLLCPTCQEEVLLGIWDRHQHAHKTDKLDKEKDDGKEKEGDV